MDKTCPEKLKKNRKSYIQARAFYFAAKRCGREEECEESGLPQNLNMPEYVNIAFACELYLKTLIYQNEEIIREHNFLELFKELNKIDRQRVKEILKMSDSDITELLDEHSDLFEEMRYYFEFNKYGAKEGFSVPLDFFYSFANALDQTARETLKFDPYPWKEPE